MLTDGRTDRQKIGRLYRTLLQAGAIINKQTMKTDNIRKLVCTNYVMNVYTKKHCLGLVMDFFFFYFVRKKKKKKLQWAHFFDIGNITFF